MVKLKITLWKLERRACNVWKEPGPRWGFAAKVIRKASVAKRRKALSVHGCICVQTECHRDCNGVWDIFELCQVEMKRKAAVPHVGFLK